MPDEAALPMPPVFLRDELDEEHEASYFAESDKILSFAFKSIVSPKVIVSLNDPSCKTWHEDVCISKGRVYALPDFMFMLL